MLLSFFLLLLFCPWAMGYLHVMGGWESICGKGVLSFVIDFLPVNGYLLFNGWLGTSLWNRSFSFVHVGDAVVCEP